MIYGDVAVIGSKLSIMSRFRPQLGELLLTIMYGDFAVSSPTSAIKISVTSSRETKRRPANSAERNGGRKLSPPATKTGEVKSGR